MLPCTLPNSPPVSSYRSHPAITLFCVLFFPLLYLVGRLLRYWIG